MMKSLVILLSVFGAALSAVNPYYGKFIGTFTNYAHRIKGDVYAMDNKNIFIKGFGYDGEGPAAYFWGGSSSKPDSTGVKIMDENGSGSSLQPYGDKDITLTLPPSLTVNTMTWISVWCEDFRVNFGDVYIPAGFEAPAPKEIGTLQTKSRGVSGKVITFDDRTIVIENFKYNSGSGAAYFWADVGNGLTAEGQLLPSSLTSQAGEKLPSYDGKQMVIVEIPEGRTIHDYNWFGVYNQDTGETYGQVKIPQNMNIPPSKSSTGSRKSRLNCEVLDDGTAYEVRWALTDNSVVMQLVGRVGEGNYMSFGLSGDEQKSQMEGGDVIVAWIDKNGKGHAKDYYLKTKESCTGDKGSCPDTHFKKANNVDFLSSNVINGFHMVTVKRPLFKQDEVGDAHVYVDGPQAVIWAIGKLSKDNKVSYHYNKRNKETLMIDFARKPTWNCPEPAEATESNKNVKQPSKKPAIKPTTLPAPRPIVQTPLQGKSSKPWRIPKFTCPRQRRFRARIGPSGGIKGYQAITGEVGWGIAWYLNGILLPEITIQRGKTYIFEVEGGNDPNNGAKTHPFYITNSPVGGYASLKDNEKQTEIIYAGARWNSKKKDYEPTSAGRLCEYELTGDRKAEEYETFAEYKRDLRVKCEPGRAKVLRWTPDDQTPDTVYYQCFTHRRLGYKINIVDSCNVRGSPSILSVKNVSSVQSTNAKDEDKPRPFVYNSKPPELPRPVVRPRPTKRPQRPDAYPKPIVVEEVVHGTKRTEKPPKRTVYVPIKIVTKQELPPNIPIHDGSPNKPFVFGNPIAVPLGPNPQHQNVRNPSEFNSGSGLNHPQRQKVRNPSNEFNSGSVSNPPQRQKVRNPSNEFNSGSGSNPPQRQKVRNPSNEFNSGSGSNHPQRQKVRNPSNEFNSGSGSNRQKVRNPSNDFNFETGFKPLILRDQSSITNPIASRFQNRPTQYVGSESVSKTSFKPPKPDTTGFKVIFPVKDKVSANSVYNKQKHQQQQQQQPDRLTEPNAPQQQNVNRPEFLRPDKDQAAENVHHPSNIHFEPNKINIAADGIERRPPHHQQHFNEDRRRPFLPPNRGPSGQNQPQANFQQVFETNHDQTRRRPPNRPNFNERPEQDFRPDSNHENQPFHRQPQFPHRRPHHDNDRRPPQHFDGRRPPPPNRRRPEQPHVDFRQPPRHSQDREPFFAEKSSPQLHRFTPDERRPVGAAATLIESDPPNRSSSYHIPNGKRNSTEYAVLSHVMEYIHQNKPHTNRRNKREDSKAEPEPKSGSGNVEGKSSSSSSEKTSNDAATVGISMFAIAAIIISAIIL